MEILSIGAEAVILKGHDKAVKHRTKKAYRINELDEKLRISRTRREANMLEKLRQMHFPSPRLIKSSDKDGKLEMEFLHGRKIRDILDSSDYKKLGREIGRKIAVLHNNNIIHGDLTTSNMILCKNAEDDDRNAEDDSRNEVYFIDFGLSFVSERAEDRAVDLHLLRQALESKHCKIWEKAFESCLDGYKKEAKTANEVLNRLEIVEMRGRYKQKGS